MTQSIIKPLRPKPDIFWIELKCHQDFTCGYAGLAFQHNEGFFAISAVEVPNIEAGSEPLGPEYHLSISKSGKRCSSGDAQWVLKQFGMEGATEDNHVPHGFVRNFWKPVAESKIGYECPCIDNEPAIKEDKGDFIWRGTS